MIKLISRLTPLLTAFFCVCPTQALAYTRHYTGVDARVALSWPKGTPIPLRLSSSLRHPPTNFKRGSDVADAVLRAVSHWEEAANVRFQISWTDQMSANQKKSGDGGCLVTVADTPENRAFFNRGSIGYTNLHYQTESGVITEAALLINPSIPFSTDGTFGTYDLESVLTHEIGHVLGLEHSALIGAVMQPTVGMNGLYGRLMLMNRTLSADDIAGARAIYGSEQKTGSIAGRVTDKDSCPIYGVHIWAEDVRTGRVVAGNISLLSGDYRIDGLPTGDYQLFAGNINGSINPSQIPSEKSAYAFLRQTAGAVANKDPLPASVRENEVSSIDFNFTDAANILMTKLSGPTGEISRVPVQIGARGSSPFYVTFDNADEIIEVKVDSPDVRVRPGGVTRRVGEANASRNILTVLVTVGERVSEGTYSVRLKSKSGKIAYLPGALVLARNDDQERGDGWLTRLRE